MEERFSTRLEASGSALLGCRGRHLCALSAFLGRYSGILMSAAQTCKIRDFLFVFSDKADGLAFNTNSLTDSRTSPDGYNLRFNISATDIYPAV